MTPNFGPLVEEVAALKGVVDSAVALIGGIAGRIDAAVQAALENGSTPEEIAAAVTAETNAIREERERLAAAVAENP